VHWPQSTPFAIQRRGGVIGTKRVSLEVVAAVVAEMFDWLVRAWASSRNMKTSASIVVLLGSLPGHFWLGLLVR